ncbi:hypothetical protein HDE76_003397 [Rhodanobacter sp. ANJX3]|jgi:hypothetical protein|uniref:hypothetical protein n=1 Tax=unclassified Rhodanobacter TaxID=2621553 RepID=UPI0015C70D61|nr:MULTISPECIES: hypothetical protein [unclassified Rhodanobacter]MBB5360155.1 hypothetical protein [Rhodanobacter sp. ANJX3]NYE29078.1 hypothetical protein [Rhodanobacter sp. K2T2]
MTTCALDALIFALQDAVIGANDSIRRRREAQLARGGMDDSDHVALRVQIPQSPAQDAPCTPVTIALSEFRDRRTPHIAMMSVEFDCRVHFLRQRGQPTPVLTMSLGKPRFAWLSRKLLHHVRISYASTNAWQPQIDIDGRPLILPALVRDMEQ